MTYSNLAIKDDHGNLHINYTAGPVALKAHQDRSMIKAVWGPVRSGKSVWACWRAMYRARSAAKKGIPLRGLVIRDTFTNLRDTTLKSFLEWFPDKSAVGRYTASDATYHLRTPGPDGKSFIEHEILFRHGQTAQDCSQFLSSEYGWALMEEVVPAFAPSGLVSPGISEEVFDLLLTRMVQRGIDRPELDLTFNPPTPGSWVYRRLISQSPEALKEMSAACFFFPAVENEHNIRPGYYDQLRKLLKGQDTTIARFVDGQIVAIYPGLPVYAKIFNSTLHVSSDLAYDPSRPLLHFWDNPPTPACLLAQVDQWGRLLILKELQGGFVDGKIMEAIGQKEFADLVNAEINVEFNGAKIGKGWVDPAHRSPSNTETKTPLQVLQSCGFHDLGFGAVDHNSRQEAVRGLLGRLVNGKGAIIISSSGCPLLIEGLAGGYRYGTNTEGTRVSGGEPLKNEFSHVANALEYGASGMFPAARPFQIQAKAPKVPRSYMSA